jgi:hypothetical protein
VKTFVDIAIVVFLLIAARSQSFGDFIEPEAKRSAEVPPVYETVEQIKLMLPCHATVERMAPCYALFTTADGTKFYLGSPGATRDVSRFLSTLQVGQTYEFPAAFIAHQQKQQ